MSNRSSAQQAADARYEKKRRAHPVTGRLTVKQEAWLDARRDSGEGRFPALKRLAGVPEI